MDEIMGDRFALSLLRGKLINISGELSPTLKRTDQIKLLTGEDPVFAQEKFKTGFSFIPYAKLIFMGNIVPSTSDSSAGFYRRTLILPFLNTIPPEKKDPQLLNKITEEELQALLKKATLEILPPFIERGFRFSVDPSIEELRDQWEDFSNPLRAFVEEYFEPAPGAKEFLPNSVLNQVYEIYCRKKGLTRPNSREFSDQMGKEGFTPDLHRLSSSEIDRFQQMGFSASSPCRGWWCNAVTVVTHKFTLTNKNVGIDIEKEKAVTSVTALQACDFNEPTDSGRRR
jgi:putative DNA primase/helicase